MNKAVLDCLVEGYEPLEAGLSLPDPDDVHVLAAAIHSNSSAIITFNLRDFPETALEQFGIEAQHPDDFIDCQFDLDAAAVVTAAQACRGRLVMFQTASPHRLVLFCTFLCGNREIAKLIERASHGHLKDFRMTGEWFDVSPVEATMTVCEMFKCLSDELDPDGALGVLEKSGTLHNVQQINKYVEFLKDRGEI
jgi:hypothetical protein